MAAHETKSTEEMLRDIAGSPVYATLDYYDDGILCSAAVGLPHVPSFEAEHEDELDDPGELFLNKLYVAPILRRNKVATRLLSAMAYVAKTNGMDTLHSVASTPHILRSFKTIFGEDNVDLYDGSPVTYDGVRVPLPITIDQAVQSFERYGQIPEDTEQRDFDFGFRINLGNVTLSSLEKPVIREV